MQKKMDLSKFQVCDLIQFAMKSEIESRKLYEELKKKTKNAFLRDRLSFLITEENKHKKVLDKLFKYLFPKKKIVIPKKNIVPLPPVKVSEGKRISAILGEAMKAEAAARNFYSAMADLFKKEKQIQKSLKFLSKMEDGHYKLLEIERDNARYFEDYEEGWELMHVGP
mgnify:CR=1 FL=1